MKRTILISSLIVGLFALVYLMQPERPIAAEEQLPRSENNTSFATCTVSTVQMSKR